MGKAYAMAAVLVIIGVIALMHEQTYQEAKEHNPKYDAKAQILAACSRIMED